MLTEASDQVTWMIEALRGFIGTNQMIAYLVMMTTRLGELHRVLKSTVRELPKRTSSNPTIYTYTATIIVALAAQQAGHPDLICSPQRVFAHMWEGF